MKLIAVGDVVVARRPGEGPSRLRLHPVELTADGEPVIPPASTARRILRQVEELSPGLAPTTRVDGDGRVRF
ncbi:MULTISPECIES: hypothetical protein [Streptomyces violaceusniger group]|uniref:Uncharacterized protein n=2 Tax=Streptomyces rhizosphaericus TaxID=114699 RepID=A0ABN1P5N2_9ACTN|nr:MULTISPECIES: hypothetical protein [Streptomyces violaceusniger group]